MLAWLVSFIAVWMMIRIIYNDIYKKRKKLVGTNK